MKLGALINFGAKGGVVVGRFVYSITTAHGTR